VPRIVNPSGVGSIPTVPGIMAIAAWIVFNFSQCNSGRRYLFNEWD
jgi:hypothetical protein